MLKKIKILVRSNELEMDDDLLTPVLNTPKTVDYWLTRQQTFALDFSQGDILNHITHSMM